MNPILRTVLGAVAGAAIGYLTDRFIGCRTGTCPLTSNPWTAMLVWSIVGAIVTAGR